MIDFVTSNKALYQPGTEPELVDVPAMQYLMIDGAGQPDMMEKDPNNTFQQAFSALYGIAYSIKMSHKKGLQPEGYENFKVPPPEGLWWMKDEKFFDMERPQDWRWTLMLRMPDYVTKTVVQEFAETLVVKKKSEVYRQVRLETYIEGQCVQLTHIGPYSEEGPNIQRLHQFAKDHGWQLHGKHHEIYYGDPRRSKPEKLKTVLRQPVRAS